jgi:hypothetical protein
LIIQVQQTAGERLYEFVREHVVTGQPWDNTAVSLTRIGSRATSLAIYCEELVVLQTTARLLKAATKYSATFGLEDPQFRISLKAYVGNYFSIPYGVLETLIMRCVDASTAASRGIPQGVRNSLTRWAMKQHRHCYSCGMPLDFNGQDLNLKFTLDHLWPQSFGGDSEDWNLLPACHNCNNWRKDLVGWMSIGIQAMNLGLDPSDIQLDRLARHYRFALHFNTAREYASRRGIQLKQALIRIGPQDPIPRIRDQDDIADFENLEIHKNEIGA